MMLLIYLYNDNDDNGGLCERMYAPFPTYAGSPKGLIGDPKTTLNLSQSPHLPSDRTEREGERSKREERVG